MSRSRAAKPSSRHRGGFTLVELLVVIGIIALLIAILMPALAKARAAANSVACKSNLKQFATALSVYLINNKNLIPYSWAHGGTWDVYEEPYGGYSWGHLLHPYVQNLNLHICPAQRGILSDPQTGSSPAGVTWVLYSHYRESPYFGGYGLGPGTMPGYIDPNVGWIWGKKKITDTNHAADVVWLFDTYLDWQPYVPSPGYGNTAFINLLGDGDRTNPANYDQYWKRPNIGFVHPMKTTNIAFLDGHVEGRRHDEVLTDTDDKAWRFPK